MVLPIITHVIAKRGQHYHYVYAGPGVSLHIGRLVN